MFWLKYSCPFCGRTAPLFVIAVLLPFFMAFMIFSGFVFWQTILLSLLFLLLTVFISIWLMHRPNRADREQMEAAQAPLWYPLPDDQIMRLRAEMLRNAPSVLHALLAGAVGGGITLLCGISPSRHRTGRNRHPVPFETMLPIAAAIAVIGFLVVVIIGARRRAWADLDETAVCIAVPVHDSFYVTHHGRHGAKWKEHYLVCYLPDGKYVLHNRYDDHRMTYILIVKFRGSTRWFPLLEHRINNPFD